MVRQVSELDLEKARRQGAEVVQRPSKIEAPQLTDIAQIMREFAAMKKDVAAKYEEKWKKKLAKMDELIEAIRACAPDNTSNGELMAMLKNIQKEHTKIASEHAALMAVEKEEHEGGHDDDEPCTYKLTGRRDNRGLIDLEYGLTFTPVDG